MLSRRYQLYLFLLCYVTPDINFKCKGIDKTQVKGKKKIYYTNTTQKKAGVALQIRQIRLTSE